MRQLGYEIRRVGSRSAVVYVVGPIFFGTVHALRNVLERLTGDDDVAISLRGLLGRLGQERIY